MNRYVEELTALLLEKNPELSEEQALLWIESLWSDFESSYAKAGYPYRGEEYACEYVKKQIAIHGDKLHHLEPKKKSEDKK